MRNIIVLSTMLVVLLLVALAIGWADLGWAENLAVEQQDFVYGLLKPEPVNQSILDIILYTAKSQALPIDSDEVFLVLDCTPPKTRWLAVRMVYQDGEWYSNGSARGSWDTTKNNDCMDFEWYNHDQCRSYIFSTCMRQDNAGGLTNHDVIMNLTNADPWIYLPRFSALDGKIRAWTLGNDFYGDLLFSVTVDQCPEFTPTPIPTKTPTSNPTTTPIPTKTPTSNPTTTPIPTPCVKDWIITVQVINGMLVVTGPDAGQVGGFESWPAEGVPVVTRCFTGFNLPVDQRYEYFVLIDNCDNWPVGCRSNIDFITVVGPELIKVPGAIKFVWSEINTPTPTPAQPTNTPTPLLPTNTPTNTRTPHFTPTATATPTPTQVPQYSEPFFTLEGDALVRYWHQSTYIDCRHLGVYCMNGGCNSIYIDGVTTLVGEIKVTRWDFYGYGPEYNLAYLNSGGCWITPTTDVDGTSVTLYQDPESSSWNLQLNW